MAKVVRMKTTAELASSEFRDRAKQQSDVLKTAYAVGEQLSKTRHQFILDITGCWTRNLDPEADDATVKKESRKWDQVRDKFLAESTKPIELHWFTCQWNAGKGSAPLLKVVANKHCDAGTALRLYWLNDPYFYQDYATLSECDDPEERSFLKLLRAIEKRFKKADFATARIPFDPAPWIQDKYLASAVHVMPSVMRQPVPAAPGK